MSTRTIVGLLAGLTLLAFGIVPVSRADNTNQATEVHFDQAMRIPGQVLPAGTYWFTVNDDFNGLDNVMLIRNADQNKVIAQLQTELTDKDPAGSAITVDGVRWPNGKVVLSIAEPQGKEPPALLAWYYPGRTDGHRLVYGSQNEKAIAAAQHETIAVSPTAGR